MRIVEQTPSSVTIEVNESGFALVLKALVLLCVFSAAFVYFGDATPKSSERFWGLLSGAGLFLIGGLAVYERATFRFDAQRQTLTWTRRRSFSQHGGTVPFEKIVRVSSRTLGNPVNPKRRLVLELVDGELPLSSAYIPGQSTLQDAVRESIEVVMKWDGKG